MRDTQPQIIRELESLFDRYRAEPGSRVFAPLADACRKAGRVEEAIEIVERGVRDHPEYAVGHVVRGKCYFDHGDADTAREAFERVLELDANNLVALKYLGMIHADAGRASRAREYFRHILALDPDDRDIRDRLEALGDEPERASATAAEAADDDFEPVPIRLGDDDEPADRDAAEALATMTLAEIYASQGYTERALRIYREILRRQPDNEEARRRVRELEGRPDAATAAGSESDTARPAPAGADADDESLRFEDVEPTPAASHRAAGRRAADAPDATAAAPAASSSSDQADGARDDDGPPRARPLDESRSYEQFKRWLRNLAD